VDAPLHYGYGDVPNVVNLSQALEGSAIRQSALPRLQIPTRASPELSSPLRSQRVDIPASFHSAAVTLSSTSKFHPAPFRGPLSAPDVSEDFQYNHMYEDPNRTVNMQVSSNAASGSASVSRSKNADAPKRRSLSPVRPARRTTTTAVIACRQWCVTYPSIFLPNSHYWHLSVARGKFAATRRVPIARTALAAPISACMTLFPNGEG
jgi:hypothetical protein